MRFLIFFHLQVRLLVLDMSYCVFISAAHGILAINGGNQVSHCKSKNTWIFQVLSIPPLVSALTFELGAMSEKRTPYDSNILACQ